MCPFRPESSRPGTWGLGVINSSRTVDVRCWLQGEIDGLKGLRVRWTENLQRSLPAAVNASSERSLHPSKNLNLALSSRIEILLSRKLWVPSGMWSFQLWSVELHCVSIAPPRLKTKGTNSKAVLDAYLVHSACAARPRTCCRVFLFGSVDRNWLEARDTMVMSNSWGPVPFAWPPRIGISVLI